MALDPVNGMTTLEGNQVKAVDWMRKVSDEQCQTEPKG